MPKEKNWQFELEEYIKQAKPEKAQKSEAWRIAIGLQAVDGLSISAYLLDAAERKFSYNELPTDESVKHLARFASDIWQIHPFGEGNTRATAVFMIKYLKILGLHTNSAVLGNSSWYFRNALVRANHNNIPKGIYSTTKYLEMFFSNLLLDTDYELKNRYMHIDYMDSDGISDWK